MATYPNAVKTFTDPTSTNTLNSPAHSTQHAEMNAEMTAVQTELGTTPKGSYASVSERLDNAVYDNGDQTVDGVKTFSSSPIVPTPTADTEAANKEYADDAAAALVIGSILDYGTSLTTSTARTQSNLKMAYGYINSIAGFATVTITNLPFTSASTYTVVCAPADAGNYVEVTNVTKVNGASFNVKNNHNDNVSGNGNIYWFAIGT